MNSLDFVDKTVGRRTGGKFLDITRYSVEVCDLIDSKEVVLRGQCFQ
jgi:hypothetical protein